VDNASGEAQFLCKLWSGESACYQIATEKTREIEADISFHEATQIQNAAFLYKLMKILVSVLHSFTISVLHALKPRTSILLFG
jgi:hypothetical protein